MRINKIKKDEAKVTLTVDELSLLNNVLYFYEKNMGIDPDARKTDANFHKLNSSVKIALNLCQYGHLDDVAIEQILKCRIKTNPPIWESHINNLLAEISNDGSEKS